MTVLKSFAPGYTLLNPECIDLTISEGLLLVAVQDQILVTNPNNNQTLLTTKIQDLANIASFEGSVWITKANTKTVQRIYPYSGLVLEEYQLNLDSVITKNSFLVATSSNELWICDSSNKVYSYSILENLLLYQFILPVSERKSACTYEDKLLVALDNKILIHDFTRAVGVYGSSYDTIILDTKAIASNNNRLLITDVTTIFTLMLNKWPFRSLTRAKELELANNSSNFTSIIHQITDISGRAPDTSRPLSSDFLSLKSLDLVPYAIENSNSIKTNASNLSEISQLLKRSHSHLHQLDIATGSHPIDGVNTNFVLTSESLDEDIDLYENGYLLARGLGHDFSLSDSNIELQQAPLTNTRVVTSYEISDKFSSGHIHRLEIPVGALDGINNTFVLSVFPAQSSLHLYKQGFLMCEGVDYTLSGLTITLVETPNSTTNLLAYFYEFDELQLSSRHVHVTDAFKIVSITDTLVLATLPLDENIQVVKQGQVLTPNIDYSLARVDKRVNFTEILDVGTSVSVIYITSSTSLDTQLAPLVTNGDFFSLDVNNFWSIKLENITIIDGISLSVRAAADTQLTVYHSLNGTDFVKIRDLKVKSGTEKFSIGDFLHKSFLETSTLKLVNTGVNSLEFSSFQVFERLEDAKLVTIRSQHDTQGKALAHLYSNDMPINLVRESTLESLHHWQLNGDAKTSELVTFTPNIRKSLSFKSSGNVCRAYQNVIVLQKKARAITVSVYVTGNVVQANDSCGVWITPLVLESTTINNVLTTQEQELSPIHVINIPKGVYRDRRFSFTYIPDFPIVSVLMRLSCESPANAILYVSKIQLEQGVLSDFTPNDPSVKAVKSLVRY